MVNNQIIGFAAIKRGRKIAQPLIDECTIDRIGNGNFVAQDNVAVICHAILADIVLSLEQIDIVIVDADIADVLRNFHNAP